LIIEKKYDMKMGIRIYLMSFFIFLNSCRAKNLHDTYISENCTQEFTRVNLKDIINSIPSYNNRFVEISGYYYRSIEEIIIAIYLTGNRNNYENTLWIDFDSGLAKVNGKDTAFLFQSMDKTYKLTGKRVKIRGTIEAHRYAGHVARIKDVCYLESLN
jgi:hypothetical protein